MRSIRIIHAADLHLDSPFQALSAAKASVRREEQGELLAALGALAADESADADFKAMCEEEIEAQSAKMAHLGKT